MNPVMRLTCLNCGHQVVITPQQAEEEQYNYCICGKEHVYPYFLDTGTRPHEWAAQRSRIRAFRAAGVVKNTGGTALLASVIGLVCFPLTLVGVGIGAYVLGFLPPNIRIYSGYRRAIAAIIIGLLGFTVEGLLLKHWLGEKNQQTTSLVQETAPDEMAAVLRAQRLFFKENGRYGGLKEIPYTPLYGDYSVYLSPTDFVGATSSGDEIIHALPMNYLPYVADDRFLGIALANLDEDPELDIWMVSETGRIVHEVDDTAVDVADDAF